MTTYTRTSGKYFNQNYQNSYFSENKARMNQNQGKRNIEETKINSRLISSPEMNTVIISPDFNDYYKKNIRATPSPYQQNYEVTKPNKNQNNLDHPTKESNNVDKNLLKDNIKPMDFFFIFPSQHNVISYLKSYEDPLNYVDLNQNVLNSLQVKSPVKGIINVENSCYMYNS